MSSPITERLGRALKRQVEQVMPRLSENGRLAEAAGQFVAPPGADGETVWRAVKDRLPATITPIPDEHLLAIPIQQGEPIPGVSITGEFGPGSWLFRDRRHLDGAKLSIARGPALGSKTAGAIIVFSACGALSPSKALTKFKVLGHGGFAAFGYLRRFPGEVTIGDGGRLEVGDRTSTSGISIKVTGSEVSIGRDCMIGGRTILHAVRAHGIVDLSQPGEPSILRKSNRIEIGDHVWLGEETRLIGNAQIGEGSVLGAFSVLAGKIPPKCVAVGNPARVVRRDCTWSRTIDVIDEDSAEFIKRST